jgi:hypothetical protein
VRFPGRSTVAALVIIVMALSSAAPLAYTHQHEVTACDEDAHESHHHHGHEHGHCHRHCHAQPAVQPVAAMLSPHVHEHVFWWGLEFVVPSDPASDSGDSPSAASGSQLSAVHSRASSPTIDLERSTLTVLPATAVISGDVAIVTQPSARRAPSRCEHNLLCDTARFERSGVQRL